MKNFYRTYTLKCGKIGKKGIEIGNLKNSTEICLHISFSVEKANVESPNTAKVQVWNLSNESLKVLDNKDCILELKAGYDMENALILVGNVANVITTMTNADRMTEIEVVDGMAELRDTNISVSFNKSVNAKSIYAHIAKKMGLPIIFGKGLSFKNIPNGFSYVGKAKEALSKISKACGLSWTIQNKVIHITKKGAGIQSKGFVLSKETGLLGIPKRITLNTGADAKQTVRGWEIDYLLNGAIGINDIIKIESEKVNGFFMIHKLTIDGDNLEGDWRCTAQVIEIKDVGKLSSSKKDKKKKKGDK